MTLSDSGQPWGNDPASTAAGLGFHLTGTEQEELVRLLQRLIQFPTPDPPGREIEMARFLHDTLQAWGLDSQLDEFVPGRANVIARLRGDGSGPGLVFSAHLDTMTIGTQPWDIPPFEGESHGGRVYGRGASDMKSGMAAMMLAARRATLWGVPLKGDLILAFAAGESSNCIGAKRIVATNGLHGAGAIVVSEPTSLRVLVAETGTWWVKATATGTAGHASGSARGQGEGANAILKIIDLAQKVRDVHFDAPKHLLLGLPTLSVGLISGGTAVNQTPDHAELSMDIRFLPGMEIDDMLATLQAVAGPDIQFETIDWKPPLEIAINHPLVELTLAACQWRLGQASTPGGVAYYSDAVVYAPALNLPRVIIGPGELGLSGQRNEYVHVEKLIAAAEIYHWLAYQALVAGRPIA
jgi:succinyl-diaminopimelate desuccinylase